MRKNLGARPYLYPCPVLILGTYDENGKPNAMNAAWGGIVGAKEIIVSLGKHKTTENILKNKAFTVSFADADHVAASDYVGIASGSNVTDKMEKAGFTTVKSEFVNAPIINELPLALECTLKEVLPDGKYVGEIVNISADESILTDGDVDLSKFFPIAVDPAKHGYYKLGEKVGNAYGDGRKLM